MNNWKIYKKKGLTEMRPYTVGEDLSGVSVSEEDIYRPTELEEPGGMIARDPDNPKDQWYISKAYFAKHYELFE